MNFWYKYIYGSYWFSRLALFLKQIKFKNPGVSLYVILLIFFNKVRDNALNHKASSVAFNFTLAIFPGIIFLFTLIPYVPVERFDELIFHFLKEIIPHNIFTDAESVIYDIVSRPKGGLLSLGFFVAFYAASSGVMSLISAFNSCYHKPDTRSFLRRQFVATALTLLLFLILLASIVLLVAGKVILRYLVAYDVLAQDYIYYLIDILRFVVIFIMFFLTVSLIYYIAPGIPQRWKFISVGSMIATVLSIGVSLLFSFYIDHFSTYNRLYGSIGAMLGTMIWLWAMSWVLLLGFEVNAAIDMAKDRWKHVNRVKEEHEAS